MTARIASAHTRTRRICYKLKSYLRTCMCTRVKTNSAPHLVWWWNDERSDCLFAEKFGNFKLRNKTNCTTDIRQVEKDAQPFFIQQMGRSHRISGILGSGIGYKRQGGKHRVLGGTSLLSKFWDNPPSLPLSENATRCKLNNCCHLYVLMCLSFCLVVVSLVCPKTKRKQKRKLREEIKSSFFSRNSQHRNFYTE